MTDVVIIGGGASGCMAAITASEQGKKVILIEKNEKIGRKLLITGKGRCNLTNNSSTDTLIKSTIRNGKFLYSAFSNFNSKDTMDFFESCGVPLKTERGNRVFPQSDKSVDIIDALFYRLKDLGVEIKKGEVDDILIDDDKIKGVKLKNNEQIFAKSVIIATGGLSYPQTGSTGDGYKFAKSVGHTIITPSPALVPVETFDDNNYHSRLQGLSLKNVNLTLFCKYKAKEKVKKIYSEQGELLFTHFGLSGPLVLTASSFIDIDDDKEYEIAIDLKPALDEQTLDKRIRKDFAEFINKDFINSLNKLLPNKLIPVFVEKSGIDGREKINSITKEERQKIVSLMKNFTFKVKSLRPIEEGIITKGGVRVTEINPKTMESKIINGLYFAGEIIDVDAKTGGFNLQIAFSTGYTAGISA
jgi:predicted Rossmann fold flavoprotein